MRRWVVISVLVLMAAGAVVVGLRHRKKEKWHPPIVLVRAGTFRAAVNCHPGLERGCELTYPPPVGKDRWRVIVWIDAFWADAGLVTREQYEACRQQGACPGNQAPPELVRRCEASAFAWVTFDDARTYCAWRGWRLPTPDEFERMGRWTDGRSHPWGNDPGSLCDHRPSPEGIRDLTLFGQWVSSPSGVGGSQGATYSYSFQPFTDGTSPFRCVRSFTDGPDAGKAKVWPQQDDPWLEGGPDW